MSKASPVQSSPSGARRGWLTHPVLSALLLASWLLLNQSVALAHWLSGAVLALVIPWAAGGFLGPANRPRRWVLALKFTFIVLWDIVVSNISVARIVLSPTSNPRPAWVPVPLDARSDAAITLLATIITTTPGTVSCVVDELRREILVHALDCDDPAAMAAQIKQRYEVPLMEILG